MFKDRNVDHIHNTYWINLLLIAQIIIIPLLLTTFISTLSTAQKSNTEQQAKVIFKTLSSEYEKIVSDSEDILATWSKDITENKLEDNPCSSPAIKRYIDDELYINYGVATPSGDIVCSKLAFPENDNLAKRIPEYVEMISSKKFVVTNFGVSAVSSEPRIGVGYPHLDREGNVQSGLFLSIRLTYVNDYIDGFDLPKNSEFLVTDDLGSIVIVYPSDNALLGKMKFPAVTFSLVLSQKSGVLKFKGEDGIERIYAYAPFYLNEKKDLISFMLFGIPTEKYFFEVSNSQLRTQIALLVLSLIGELTIFSLIMKSKRK